MAPFRILIINPNTTQSMTDGLKPLVESLAYQDTTYTYFTAPTGPRSINNATDVLTSAEHCLPALEPLLASHDGFLVACYSQHPLVLRLKHACGGKKPVVGIFEASITAAMHLASSIKGEEQFGIVSTGKVWEGLLTEGVESMLGATNGGFAGVETTGLDATELHDVPQEEVRRRIKEAVGRLARRGDGSLTVVVLGCAGMAGMDEWVREEVESRVRVVDGVKAGVGVLQGLCRGGF